jgi:hypothetical protein
MGDRLAQTRSPMKTRAPLFLMLVAVVVGSFWFSASAATKDKAPAGANNNVVIKADTIVIPGTQISKSDQEAMNRILNKYDKSLYRLDTYENGKRTRSQGKLTDVVTDKKLASEIAANTKKAGFTQNAVQIIRSGVTTGTTNPNSSSSGANPKPGIVTGTTSPQTATNSDSAAGAKSAQMLERLRPILQKYQRK